MRRLASAAVAPLILLSVCTLPAILLTGLLPSPSFASQDEIVTETVSLTYQKPSRFLRIFTDKDFLGMRSQNQGAFLSGSQTPQPESLLPAGTVGMVPNDAAKTFTVTGTKAAVAEIKHIVSLLDVKPLQVILKTRLVETRVESDGRRSKNILQTSSFVAGNNQPLHTAITVSMEDQLDLTLTPHVNGDKTLSLLVALQRKRQEDPEVKSEITSASTYMGERTYRRLQKIDEWITMPRMTFAKDQNVKFSVAPTAVPLPEAYPLYTLEVLFTYPEGATPPTAKS